MNLQIKRFNQSLFLFKFWWNDEMMNMTHFWWNNVWWVDFDCCGTVERIFRKVPWNVENAFILIDLLILSLFHSLINTTSKYSLIHFHFVFNERKKSSALPGRTKIHSDLMLIYGFVWCLDFNDTQNFWQKFDDDDVDDIIDEYDKHFDKIDEHDNVLIKLMNMTTFLIKLMNMTTLLMKLKKMNVWGRKYTSKLQK